MTPRATFLLLRGRHFCVTYDDPRDVETAHEIGQSVLLDNGAYTFWKRGRVVDWDKFMDWAEPWLEYHTTWAVIPDVIEGTPEENDALIERWRDRGLPRGAPVWHLHEPVDRLLRLAEEWPRVCLGSSGAYATLNDARWRGRMNEAMDALCGDGPPPTWLHMLRGLSLTGDVYPFASADSVTIARGWIGCNNRGRQPKDVVAMADRIDARQCPARWRRTPEQMALST